MTRPLSPTLPAALFTPLSDAFVALLRGLAPADWERATVSAHWNVRQIASHVLDGQLRRLSFQRDGWPVPAPDRPIAGHEDLVRYLNSLNASWVDVARRFSPRVLIDLLEQAGRATGDMAAALDPFGPALFAVAWAGETESPLWFDLARDLTEHWHHQQQIRLAVGAPLLLDAWISAPVMDAFARALPHAYRAAPAPEGAPIAIAVAPPVGRSYAPEGPHRPRRRERLAHLHGRPPQSGGPRARGRDRRRRTRRAVLRRRGDHEVNGLSPFGRVTAVQSATANRSGHAAASPA